MDRERLISILGMLGSDNAGERASAGKAAAKMVQDAGKTWDDVVGGASAEARCNLALELVARGWPPIASAGMAAVLRPPMNGKANIAGWHGARWSQLSDWCSAHNHKDPNAAENQLNYLHNNLIGVYLSLSTKIRAANTVAEAKKLFSQYMGDAEGSLK